MTIDFHHQNMIRHFKVLSFFIKWVKNNPDAKIKKLSLDHDLGVNYMVVAELLFLLFIFDTNVFASATSNFSFIELFGEISKMIITNRSLIIVLFH